MKSTLRKALPYIAVPLASFLTFMTQPVVGKLVLPTFGGSSASWLMSMFFFQGVLLGGYLLAYAVLHRTPAVQRTVVLALAVLAPLLFRLPLWQIGNEASPASLILTLAASLTAPLLFTTSIGIVLHGWMADADGGVPYHLYALSNLGSLAALVAYPFLIEPRIGIEVQMGALRVVAVVLSAVCIVYALGLGKTAPRSASEAAEEPERLPLSQKLHWLLLSFVACVVLLGGTRVLASEFGSNPITWIIPLGLYLASFSITFTTLWRPRFNLAVFVLLAASLWVFLLKKGVLAAPVRGEGLVALIVMLASVFLTANGALYASRPKRDFATFYVVIALGGALGGFFASLSAPYLFVRDYEFIVSAAVVGLVVLVRQLSRDSWIEKAVLATAFLFPIGAVLQVSVSAESRGQTMVYLRNHFGRIILRQTEHELVCASESTIHGSQARREELRLLPTSYFSRNNSIGIVLAEFQRTRERFNLGVIGLGVGTMAAYSRPGDTTVFWEIDPLMREVALNDFTYLSSARGAIEIRMMDGRLGVETHRTPLDLVLVDAFSGDAVPIHLLTREAVQIYHRAAPGALVAIHISNRYVDLFPVIATHASELGLSVLSVNSRPLDRGTPEDVLAAPSHYVYLGAPEQIDRVRRAVIAAAKNPAWEYRFAVKTNTPVHWTDSRSSILDVLHLREALSRH